MTCSLGVDIPWLRGVDFLEPGTAISSGDLEAKTNVKIAIEDVFDYIEVFYNQRRRHSALGQISPAEFEGRFNGA